MQSMLKLWLGLWPELWWRLDLWNDKDMIRVWEHAIPATPHWFMFSVAMLALSTVFKMDRISCLCILAHGVTAFGSLLLAAAMTPKTLFTGMTVTDAVIFHAVWLNALFAWLHWLNISLRMDDTKPA